MYSFLYILASDNMRQPLQIYHDATSNISKYENYKAILDYFFYMCHIYNCTLEFCLVLHWRFLVFNPYYPMSLFMFLLKFSIFRIYI